MRDSVPRQTSSNPKQKSVSQVAKHTICASSGKGTPEDADMARLLYHIASLRGGYEIENPMEFASLVTKLMS
jgi:hypothetical protein